MTDDDDERRDARRRVVLWVVIVYPGWVLAWLASRALLGAGASDAFVYWLVAKLTLWVGASAAILGLRGWWGDAARGSWRTWAAIAGAALVWVGVSALAGPTPPRQDPWSEATLTIVVIAPVLEELLFRGVLWTRLVDAGVDERTTWLVTAAAFALLHVPGWIVTSGLSADLVSRLGLIFFAGLFFGLGRRLTGRVGAAIALHFVNNLWSAGLLSFP
ncbi:MAG: CPBP family intramembrane metalloprotease [Myxococcales bacterium]|nr:CPBP family intramembrane metalloprotease [Myxococcales bacterium]